MLIISEFWIILTFISAFLAPVCYVFWLQHRVFHVKKSFSGIYVHLCSNTHFFMLQLPLRKYFPSFQSSFCGLKIRIILVRAQKPSQFLFIHSFFCSMYFHFSIFFLPRLWFPNPQSLVFNFLFAVNLWWDFIVCYYFLHFLHKLVDWLT